MFPFPHSECLFIKYFNFVNVSKYKQVFLVLTFLTHVLVCPVHHYQDFSVFDHNFFILKFHYFMLLLNLMIFKYSFFRRIIQVFQLPIFLQIFPVLGQFLGKHFLQLHCSCSAFSDCSEGSYQFLKIFCFFYFPFSQFPTIISSSIFLKLTISLVFREVLLYIWCYNP